MKRISLILLLLTACVKINPKYTDTTKNLLQKFNDQTITRNDLELNENEILDLLRDLGLRYLEEDKD